MMEGKTRYLLDEVNAMNAHWPQNKTLNIVFHGHSVPAGYFATPMIDTFHAYPHLVHAALKERFPFAVINAIVTAIGGEHSESGAARFTDEVLNHKPDILCIDYGLNDRLIGLEKARDAWVSMIESALARSIKVLLFTPTWDLPEYEARGKATPLSAQTDQIRALAATYPVGLVDSYKAFADYLATGKNFQDLMSWSNHPNARGHALVRDGIMGWLPLV
jgi:hypothetical protein